jgi:DNA primase small subunit
MSDEVLRSYYRNLFPFEYYYRWMNYGDKDGSEQTFSNREFAYGLPEEVFVRYRSFTNDADFKEDVVSVCSERIDIGPVYNQLPKMHKGTPENASFVLTSI